MKIPSLGFSCLVVHELLDRVISCLVFVPQIIQYRFVSEKFFTRFLKAVLCY